MEWNLDEALDYYHRQGAPGDQNALISLLKEIQKENGCIPAGTAWSCAPGRTAENPRFLRTMQRKLRPEA